MTNTPTITYDGEGKITIRKTVIEETSGINIHEHHEDLITQLEKVDKVYKDIAETKKILETQISDMKTIIEQHRLDPELLQNIYDSILEDVREGLKQSTIRSKYEIQDIRGLAINLLGNVEEGLDENSLINLIKEYIASEKIEEVVEE